MQKLIKTNKQGIIESTQNWPDNAPAPKGFQARPFLDDRVECGPLAKTKWQLTDAPPYAREILPSDEEKATAIRRKIADAANKKCADKIINGLTVDGIPAFLPVIRQDQISKLWALRDRQKYPYFLKINTDKDGHGIYVELKSSRDFTNKYYELFDEIQAILIENQAFKNSLKTKTLAVLTEIEKKWIT